ncbi:hypothetical protein FFV08_01915 [Streptococcus sanguinis]|uniref:Uncharacterized protein n=1 Tax=Streptococcus sanguinis TaxID=1305 RepID=A0A7H8V519_STRSA|nr:hypothetical protein FFV08_01915 [Streptococcus sanguinis]
MKLKIGLYESPRKLVEAIAKETSVPDTITPIEFSTGVINEGKESEFLYANLTAVDSELREKFESIGQEEHCPTFKVKLRGYKGEDLTPLIGKELTFTEYEVAFVFDKYKQPIGLSLVLELSSISVI